MTDLAPSKHLPQTARLLDAPESDLGLVTTQQRALENLAERAREQMSVMAYPTAEWVQAVTAPDGTRVLDCAVIGAGQFGLAIAAGLRREQVGNIGVFDAAAEGREGPWVTFARMQMLRTGKDLTGTDGGIPALTFRAWWEAQHGAESWETLHRIPRTIWMDYLNWLRRTLDLPIKNLSRLVRLEPEENGLLRLHFSGPAGESVTYARTCVLATGSLGLGRYGIPDFIADNVPPDRAYHANDVFDLKLLKGQRVGVLGAGASAFDLALGALDAGAVSADICFRRPSLPGINPRRWMENAGYLAHYVDLPDAQKWSTMNHLLSIGQGPPRPTYDRAMRASSLTVRPATPWRTLRWTGEEIEVDTGGGLLHFDAVVSATGMRVNLRDNPETAALADAAAIWGERYAPPVEEANPDLACYPYLDRFGAFTPRHGAADSWVSRVLTISRATTLSLCPVGPSNSGMKYMVPRLVEGVKRQLFLEQSEEMWHAFMHGNHRELPQ